MKTSRATCLIGKKFGRLLVVSRGPNYIQLRNGKLEQTAARWECICDCGNKTLSFATSLKSGKGKSCGCYAIDRVRKRHLRAAGHISWNSLFKRYKINAKDMGRNFELSFEEFKKLLSQDCSYCGLNPQPYNYYINTDGLPRQGVITIHKDTVDRSWINVGSIDRIDNNQHYIISNCIPCCENCNFMKWKRSTKDFLNHIKRIYEFQN